MKWAAVSYCSKRVPRPDGGYDNEHQLYPYMIEADSYHEALGKAVVCLEFLKKHRPGEDHYSFKVNSLGESHTISDPRNMAIVPEE